MAACMQAILDAFEWQDGSVSDDADNKKADPKVGFFTEQEAITSCRQPEQPEQLQPV